MTPWLAWTTPRAAEPMRWTKEGSLKAWRSCTDRSSAFLAWIPPPAWTKRWAVSAQWSVYGPKKTGFPHRAGSRRLWPPTGTKVPPTNVTCPKAYTFANSPLVSRMMTRASLSFCSSTFACFMALRRIGTYPAPRILASTISALSTWRGAIKRTVSGWSRRSRP